MPLSLPPGARDATDVPSAIRAATQAGGHRPAITLLAPDGRQEQSFASLAQWVAKTAHWIELDLMLEPGARMGLVGPPGWVPAAAALGAWWAGLTVVVGNAAAEADVVVAHADLAPTSRGEVVAWGWGFDGTPGSPTPAEAFVRVVQPFPDDPPAPVGTGSSTCLDDGTRVIAQAPLLDEFREAPRSTVGIGPSTEGWLPAVALRPLLTGRPTVMLAPGVDRDAAAGDRVADWLP